MLPPVSVQKRWQKVDALTDLLLDDPLVERDAKILANLRKTVRKLVPKPLASSIAANRPSLYSRYRGNGFPLQGIHGRRLPRWRDLTPWMKVQLATLALSETGYMQFKLHVHDDLRAELEAGGVDLREWLRDSLTRNLKRRFSEAPWFFFVMEGHTKSGEPTRPHAHGSIEIRSVPFGSRSTRSLGERRMIEKKGLAVAELEAGKKLTVAALKACSGNVKGDRPRIAITSGLDQCRNLWPRPPYHPLFNSPWVDYAFKNAKRVSVTLGETRLVLPHDLRREARRLWNLVREGESALSQWSP